MFFHMWASKNSEFLDFTTLLPIPPAFYFQCNWMYEVWMWKVPSTVFAVSTFLNVKTANMKDQSRFSILWRPIFQADPTILSVTTPWIFLSFPDCLLLSWSWLITILDNMPTFYSIWIKSLAVTELVMHPESWWSLTEN